ncbi:protein BTG4 [Protopterus annectens]|uniref:protein BTG4 n=1 Tax=Protopterus annectens TaxID=7888 RepID=UPI001CFA6D54|nr:protein BTG4 [Protopterus annectens]
MKNVIVVCGEGEDFSSGFWRAGITFFVWLYNFIGGPCNLIMKEEIAATVFFITKIVKKHDKLKKETIEKCALHLTSILFEHYKGHWYPATPVKGQAYRCIRVNKFHNVDPLLERTCKECNVDYEDLGLPKELTIWVDPFEVACRYGEKNQPFTIARFEGSGDDRETSRMINNAVEKVTSDYQSGTSSDEESCSKEPKSIPTVSNPNSVYQFTEFFYQPVPVWSQYPRRKNFTNDYNQQANVCPPYKMVRTYRPSAAFAGPRVDRYHWVNAKR